MATSDPFSIPAPATLTVDELCAAAEALDDGDLDALGAHIRSVQFARSVEAADPEALAKVGFERGFGSDGTPRDPIVESGMILCFGARRDRSASSHDCAFVVVGDDWVWDSPQMVHDAVTHPPSPKPQMRSVTLIAPYDGLELDLIASTASMGQHKAKSVKSFRYEGGQLTLVARRNRSAPSHGR